VLTSAAYEHLETLGERMRAGCEAVIEGHDLPRMPSRSVRRAA
jgi:hypothetical protein